MRIISGELGGRTIRGPKGDATRPITDRVKTNLFNILAPRLAGAIVADCFCGTGSLGVESLSRGAAFAVFAEIDASALRLLRENIDELGLGERARIVRHDVLRRGLPISPPLGGKGQGRGEGAGQSGPILSKDGSATPEPAALGLNGGLDADGAFLRPRVPASPRPYSLVFLDPPYRITETAAERLWLKLNESADAGLLADDAVIVWRHDSRIELSTPAEYAERICIADVRTYGSQTLTFIARV